MSEVNRVLRAAGLRLMLTAFFRNLVLALTAALVAVIILRVLSVVFGIGVDWLSIAWYGPAVVLGASLIWSLFTIPRRMAIARRVDEGANLKETISTALSVTGQTDPWCQTVIESAVAKARTVNVAQAVPVTAPRSWPLPLTAAFACVIVWILPLPQDVLGKLKSKQENENKQKEIAKTNVEVKEATQKVEELLKKIDPEAGKDLGKNEPEGKKPEEITPEDIRRAAIKKVESMAEKLEKMRSESDKAQAADALQDMLKQLKNTPGPLEDMAKAMAKGDMGKAMEELKKVQDKMASGQMSAAEKEQMGKQLENFKSQLEKLAQSQKQLEDKLKQSGLDPKLASDPDALKKALEDNKNLSQEQKQALQKASEAKKSADQSCQSLAQCMSKAASKMGQNGQEGQEGQEGQQGAMAEMASQMSEMEMMMAEAQQMDAAMSEAQHQLKQLCEGMGQCNNPGMGECQGGLMNKPWSAGDTNKQSGQGARGGPGQGQGGSNTEQQADETWSKRKVTSKNGGGPIIGSTLIEGEQIKGESKAEFAQVADSAEAQASEALENNVIPREYHDVVKHYFGRLKSKSQAQQEKKAAAAPAEEAKPEPKKDEKK